MNQIIKQGTDFIKRNSPTILTAAGSAGVIFTAVYTGYASVKAYEVVKAYEEETKEETDLKKKIELSWKFYIPPVLIGATSIASILGANSISNKRTAAIAGLYSLTNDALKDYRKKVIEELGEKKEKAITDSVREDHILKNPPTDQNIIKTMHGDTLCYDSYSGRYFKSDIEFIRRTVNDLNHDLMGACWTSLNDFYYALGLETVKLGDDLGWTVDELIELDYTSKLTDDGTPCLVIDYEVTPKYIKKW